jgi:hypothetical protein
VWTQVVGGVVAQVARSTRHHRSAPSTPYNHRTALHQSIHPHQYLLLLLVQYHGSVARTTSQSERVTRCLSRSIVGLMPDPSLRVIKGATPVSAWAGCDQGIPFTNNTGPFLFFSLSYTRLANQRLRLLQEKKLAIAKQFVDLGYLHSQTPTSPTCWS